MSKFKKGDNIIVNTAHVDVTVGNVYEVLNLNGDHVEIRDDAGDLHDIQEDYVSRAPVVQPAKDSNLTPFVTGEQVTCNSNGLKHLTQGKVYQVVSTSGRYVRVTTDHGTVDGYDYQHFSLYTGSQAVVSPHQGAMGAGNRAKARAVPAHITPPADYPEFEAVVEEDDYDTRKANASVTSAGLFAIGTRLVYKDGTPTLTSLTVKQCTATCVWFEETYSAAFDPNEFTMEY